MNNQTSQVELITTEGQYSVTRIEVADSQRTIITNQSSQLNQSTFEQQENKQNGFWCILYFICQVLFLIITYYAIKRGDPTRLDALITNDNIQCGVTEGYKECPNLFYSERYSYCTQICQGVDIVLCNGQKLSNVYYNNMGGIMYGGLEWMCVNDSLKSIPLTIFIETLVVGVASALLSMVLLQFMKGCFTITNIMASILVLLLSLGFFVYQICLVALTSLINAFGFAHNWILHITLGLLLIIYSIYKIVCYCRYSTLIQKSFIDTKSILNKFDNNFTFKCLMILAFIAIAIFQQIIIIYIISSGTPQKFLYDPFVFRVEINEFTVVMLICAIICFYWNCMFLITFQKCVYSYACVKSYGQQINSNNTYIKESIKYNWKYNIGTIAQVALTQQISQIILTVFCCFSNRIVANNYTFIHMHHKQQEYYKSSSETCKVIYANPEISKGGSELGSLGMWSIKLLTCLLIPILAIIYYFYDHYGGQLYQYLVLFCFVVSFMVAKIIFTSYEIVVDSIYFLSLMEFQNNKQLVSQPKNLRLYFQQYNSQSFDVKL